MDGHALWPGPGEWVRADVLMPAHSDYVVVCPKTRPLEWWWDAHPPVDVTAVGAIYPADPRLVPLIRSVSGEAPVVFVGDMDPVGIAQYLAMRMSFRNASGTEVLYGGIGHTWFAALPRFLSRRMPVTNLRIRLEAAERRLWRRLEASEDLDQLVGPEASRLLRSGYKIELEAVSNPSISTRGYKRWVFAHLRSIAKRRAER